MAETVARAALKSFNITEKPSRQSRSKVITSFATDHKSGCSVAEHSNVHPMWPLPHRVWHTMVHKSYPRSSQTWHFRLESYALPTTHQSAQNCVPWTNGSHLLAKVSASEYGQPRMPNTRTPLITLYSFHLHSPDKCPLTVSLQQTQSPHCPLASKTGRPLQGQVSSKKENIQH